MQEPTELGASTKRVALCTDDRDADDLLQFGLDWVARQAMRAGLPPERAWSLGSLNSATRFGQDNEVGGLGGGRRADLVLLDDDWVPQNTWYGGALMVEDRRITPLLDAALEQRYRYPAAAYATVRLPAHVPLTPALPHQACTANVIRTALPGITLVHERLALKPASDWPSLLAAHDLCFVSVVERHGRSEGAVAHGLLRGFGLRDGAVASSVGHDSHNIIVAGTNEADMQAALRAIAGLNGGVCVVRDGAVVASVPLPIAGLLSDQRVTVVADAVKALKAAWNAAGCTLPYMGFNLIPLSVIPEIRITDKGIVLVPEMTLVPLFE